MLDCEKFNIGEYATKTFLELNGYTVNDVSKNPEYFRNGYDFTAFKEDGKVIRIESKFDSYIGYSNSLFFETE